MQIKRGLDVKRIRARRQEKENKKKKFEKDSCKAKEDVIKIKEEIERFCSADPDVYLILFKSEYLYYIVKKLKLTRNWMLNMNFFSPPTPKKDTSEYYCSYILEIFTEEMREYYLNHLENLDPENRLSVFNDICPQIFKNSFEFGIHNYIIEDPSQVSKILNSINGE